MMPYRNYIHIPSLRKGRVWKRLVCVSLLAVCLAMPAMLHAQAFHQVGFYADGGWSSFAVSTSASSAAGVKAGPGCMVGAGLAYEMQYQHLLLDAGLGLQWRNAGVKVGDDAFFYGNKLMDTQGTPFRLNVATQNRRDYVRQAELQIPLLMGVVYNHFYFLGGVKLNVPMGGASRTKTYITTSGYYDRYPLPITSMDSHGFYTDVYTDARGVKVQMKPVDLKLSLELGYSFSSSAWVRRPHGGMQQKMRTRFAVFMDYSLLNQHDNAYAYAPIEVDKNYPYDIRQYTMTHVFNTDKAYDSYIAGINLGVKLTILFGNRRRFHCATCD